MTNSAWDNSWSPAQKYKNLKGSLVSEAPIIMSWWSEEPQESDYQRDYMKWIELLMYNGKTWKAESPYIGQWSPIGQYRNKLGERNNMLIDKDEIIVLHE